MENERQEREQDREKQAEAARAAGEHVAGRRGVLFAETLKTLSRLSSSYRRCHWKSASELIFPLLFQHMTFASHRTWKLYVKKAIFLLWKLGGSSMARAFCDRRRIWMLLLIQWCFVAMALIQ